MANPVLYLFISIGTMLMVSGQAQAANCADRSVIVQRLAAIYGETPRSAILGPEDSLVELFAAPLTGSWTIAMTKSGGQTCLIAAGQAFSWRRWWLGTLGYFEV